MLTLQEQVVQKVSGLSEDNLQFILKMINCFMQSDSAEKKKAVILKKIGIAKGQALMRMIMILMSNVANFHTT